MLHSSGANHLYESEMPLLCVNGTPVISSRIFENRGQIARNCQSTIHRASVHSVVPTEVLLSSPAYTGHLYMFSSVRYILPSHIPHSSLHSIPFLFRFASFWYSSVQYGHICPPPVSSILVYMSYATLPHIYGLLSPSSFSYISSIHCCMYSLF